jgi:hypothetical protein
VLAVTILISVLTPTCLAVLQMAPVMVVAHRAADPLLTESHLHTPQTRTNRTLTWAVNSQILRTSMYSNAMLVDLNAPRLMSVMATRNATTVPSNLGGLTMWHETITNNSDDLIENTKQQKIVDAWKHKDSTQNDFDRSTIGKNNVGKNNVDRNSFDRNIFDRNASDKNEFDKNIYYARQSAAAMMNVSRPKKLKTEKGTVRGIHVVKMRAVKVAAVGHAKEARITLVLHLGCPASHNLTTIGD